MSTTPELERLYDQHAQALFAFLLNLTRDMEDTRDLLQDLFVKLARQPSLLQGIRDERAFLLRTAHNAALDMMRRRASRQRLAQAVASDAQILSPFQPAADPDEQAFRNAVADALAELPLEQRSVVHLKLWAGLTFEQIAAVLDIPQNTAASRYRYGMDKLRARLRPYCKEQS